MNATHEEWRPVVGFEGKYEVSSLGRVRSLGRVMMRRNGVPKTIAGRVVSPFHVPPVGYRYVHLWDGTGKRFSRGVHTLVLEAFVGPRKSGMVGCHNNGDAADNSIENLRWDTRHQNNLDILRHGRHVNANKTHCLRGGHPLSGDNLYINPTSGARQCRQCVREARRASVRKEAS